MADYTLTNKAKDDLSNIWNYTFEYWSEEQADKYYHSLITCFQEIAVSPTIGKNYSHIFNDVFGFKRHRHIIFYRRLNAQTILIVRILHKKMDIENQLRS
jgi:toxin ParE1/3/4